MGTIVFFLANWVFSSLNWKLSQISRGVGLLETPATGCEVGVCIRTSSNYTKSMFKIVSYNHCSVFNFVCLNLLSLTMQK